MNIHHLELFYHVARCGGISAAARGMSYGIQQPAISHQVGLLEKDLGVTLFERRPFALTPAGRSLYDFARSFFGHLDDVAERLGVRGTTNTSAAPGMYDDGSGKARWWDGQNWV